MTVDDKAIWAFAQDCFQSSWILGEGSIVSPGAEGAILTQTPGSARCGRKTP